MCLLIAHMNDNEIYAYFSIIIPQCSVSILTIIEQKSHEFSAKKLFDLMKFMLYVITEVIQNFTSTY